MLTWVAQVHPEARGKGGLRSRCPLTRRLLELSRQRCVTEAAPGPFRVAPPSPAWGGSAVCCDLGCTLWKQQHFLKPAAEFR